MPGPKKPSFPVVSGEYPMTAEWTIALPGKFKRRIEDGSYGRCQNCDKVMADARLRAIPYADLCIDCKSEEERHR